MECFHVAVTRDCEAEAERTLRGIKTRLHGIKVQFVFTFQRAGKQNTTGCY
jgi:hypothetical protein